MGPWGQVSQGLTGSKKTNQHSPKGHGEPFWAQVLSSQDEIFAESDQNRKKLIISETITKVQKAT